LVKFLVAIAVLTGGIFGFQYIVKAISITNVTPNAGSVVGGQEITITGDFTYSPMQQMTKSFCDNEMSIYPTGDSKPDTMILTDMRDGQDYRIRKLADGKCWMIDNLKLELTDGMVLTPGDTNVAADTTVALATGGLGGNFTSSGFLTVDNTNAAGTDYDNYNAWRQVDPNETPNCQNNTGTGGKAYNDDSATGCGYLYNFYTATASAGDNTKTTQYDTVESSICPAGWRLPTGMVAGAGTDSDFQNLSVNYGGTGAQQIGASSLAVLANLWLSAGAWQGAFGGAYGFASAPVRQGTYGLYWSASVNSAQGVYTTQFYNRGINPGVLNDSRMNGFAVRCLVDENYTPSPVVPVVTVGGVAATVVSYSDTKIVIKTPPHPAGKVDITVTRGSQAFTLPNVYEYLATPVVPIVPGVPNTGILSAKPY
jgi:uncharacterized protein (TIGR02145 family)